MTRPDDQTALELMRESAASLQASLASGRDMLERTDITPAAREGIELRCAHIEWELMRRH
jgi:hypothetical protein